MMIIVRLHKSKRMAVGTVSRGRKKIAEGKWVPVKKGSGTKKKKFKADSVEWQYASSKSSTMDETQTVFEYMSTHKGILSTYMTEDRAYPKGEGVTYSDWLHNSATDAEKESEISIIKKEVNDALKDSKSLIKFLKKYDVKLVDTGGYIGKPTLTTSEYTINNAKKIFSLDDIEFTKALNGSKTITASESGMRKSRIMIKAKFLKRWRGKDGKWQYKYQDDGKGARRDETIEIIPADKFDASSYFDKTDDPNASVESVLENAPPETLEKIKETEAKLKTITQTVENHRTSGEGAAAVYTPERMKLHTEIIERMFSPDKINSALPEAGKSPTFTMLGGRGGSGKSWFNGKVYDPEKNVVLDSDEIKKQLPEYKGWNAFEVHEESSDILEKAAAMAKAYGLNIVIDATMKTTGSAVARVIDFKKAGYKIEAHYMHAPRQVSAQRAVKRFTGPTGRYVPVAVVLSNISNEKTFDAVKQYAATWSFRDSSGPPPPKLVSKKNGGMPMSKAIEEKEKEVNFDEIRNPDPYDMYDFGPVVDEKDYSPDLKEMIERNRPEKMTKSKYLKRWKNREGKWNYKYHSIGVSTKKDKTEGFEKGELFIIDMGKGPEKVIIAEDFKSDPDKKEYQFVRVIRHTSGYPDEIALIESSRFDSAIIHKPIRKSRVIMRNLIRKARRQKIVTMAKLKTIGAPPAEYDHKYKLQGKMSWHGLNVSIENKKGTYRRGKDPDGKPWKTFMNFDYGRIGGTKGIDAEGVDIYLGPDDTAEKVYVVHQQDPFTRVYDEDKAMCDFPSKDSAIEGFLSQYDRPDFLGPVSEFTIKDFKAALKEKRGTMLYRSPTLIKGIRKDDMGKTRIIVRDMRKAKKMAIGTESKGRKKVAEGKWVEIGKEKKGKAEGFNELPLKRGDLKVELVLKLLKGSIDKPLPVLEKMNKQISKHFGLEAKESPENKKREAQYHVASNIIDAAIKINKMKPIERKWEIEEDSLQYIAEDIQQHHIKYKYAGSSEDD